MCEAVLRLSLYTTYTVVNAVAGHQKKLMLAVEKLKRISAALLRHSTLRHHYADVKDTQGHNGGRCNTLPTDNCCSSAVVPINVCHSTSRLPVTSQVPVGRSFDDVRTPTNDQCVTSFGAVAPYRFSDGHGSRNTSTNFGAVNGLDGMVNVNGVCFSVYGTLPRNLVRRRAKQGHVVQGHVEGQGQKFSDTSSSDSGGTLRRKPAPSPPKRTNSIKTDRRQCSEEIDDGESTLTRRRCAATPSECGVNDSSRQQIATARRRQETNSAAETGFSPSFAIEDLDTTKHDTARQTASLADAVQRPPNDTDETSENTLALDHEFDSGTVQRRHTNRTSTKSVTSQDDDTAGVSVSDEVVVLDQEFDGGTLKRLQTPTNARLTHRLREQNHQQAEADGDGANRKDVMVVLDQEFDGGTVKRRPKSSADDSSQSTVSTTTNVNIS